jgi:hypothetical protein
VGELQLTKLGVSVTAPEHRLFAGCAKICNEKTRESKDKNTFFLPTKRYNRVVFIGNTYIIFGKDI